MKCTQKDCDELAVWIMHWPSQPVSSCDKHKAQIEVIGEAMGVHVHAEKIGPQTACAICGLECDGADDWCYGCNNAICEECANRQTQRQLAVDNNEHTLEDHRP
jgi:hypothetical protein